MHIVQIGSSGVCAWKITGKNIIDRREFSTRAETKETGIDYSITFFLFCTSSTI